MTATATEQLAALTLSQDISVVPLLDGETSSWGNNLMNRFGGNTTIAYNSTVSHTADPAMVRTGDGAVQVDVNIPQWGFSFVITELGGDQPSSAYVDTRDLTVFESVKLHLRNKTGTAFTFILEVKDYRDDNAHKASQAFTVGSADTWTEIVVPLNLADPGWTVAGNPDFSRARQFALLVVADQGSTVNGPVILDDMVLIEPGGSLDPTTAPLRDLVERLAERQFRVLWGARDPVTGALATNSWDAQNLAMNSTGSLVKMLPGAIDRGWVSRADADAFVTAMLNTINTTMDNVQATGNGGYLPPRYIDRATMLPASFGPPEESSIDAAMMFLGMYQYKAQPQTSPALRTAVKNTLDRFNFAPFSTPTGWNWAWFYDTQSFAPGTYDGYGGENWIISLAAHLADVNHVDITTQYHSSVLRTKDYLTDHGLQHLVLTYDCCRPPFLQWQLDLFVDTNDRGLDSYPNQSLASNPFDNAVRYQTDVNAYFDSIGRGLFLQPDAGSSGTQYRQFSAYNDYGEPDVFMPWSSSFGLLGDPQSTEAAIRNSLSHNLHGPFGLSDSAIWQTGALEPTSHPAANDLWNTSLATMAMLEYLYDDNQAFTELPEVVAALDAVFPNPVITGDLNKDGFVGIDDLNLVLGNWNQLVAPGDYFSGDPSGDGFVGIDDLNAVLGNWNAGTPPHAAASSIQEPADEQSNATTRPRETEPIKRHSSSNVTTDSTVADSDVTNRTALAAWWNESPAAFPSMSSMGPYAPPLSLWELERSTETLEVGPSLST